MDGEEKEIIKYTNNPSQNLESWRELQKKEDKQFNTQARDSRMKLVGELYLKNSYFHQSKKAEVKAKDQEAYRKKIEEKSKGMVEENNKVNDFCMKCASNKNFCPHRSIREEPKEKHSYPILTNSAYGWLPPIDNFSQKNNLNSVTKSFFDSSHLNIHKY
jgi:phage/plasmid-associated DNA primase